MPSAIHYAIFTRVALLTLIIKKKKKETRKESLGEIFNKTRPEQEGEGSFYGGWRKTLADTDKGSWFDHL